MAASFKVEVAPSVLVWARKSAGYRVDEAATKLHVEDALVYSWEAGEEQPTIAQLQKLAHAYRRPLSVFLLAEPPKDGQAMKDFRRAAEAGEMSRELRFAVREAQERRLVAIDLTEAAGDPKDGFDVVASMTDPAEEVAARIRSALGVSLDEQTALPSAASALSRWRGALEARGILVFGFAKVDPHEAGGFSIVEHPFPVVAVNNADAPVRRMFSLAHELAHVALRGENALCDLAEEDPERVEVFCNHVAGAMLVPAAALLADAAVSRASSRSTWSPERIEVLSRRFRVSREVILRRLLVLERTSAAHYREWRKAFAAEHAAHARARDEATGGPSYYAKVVSQMGRLYARVVLEAAGREAITDSAASAYLGVKVNHFPELFGELARGGG